MYCLYNDIPASSAMLSLMLSLYMCCNVRQRTCACVCSAPPTYSGTGYLSHISLRHNLPYVVLDQLPPPSHITHMYTTIQHHSRPILMISSPKIPMLLTYIHLVPPFHQFLPSSLSGSSKASS